jgi:hypothetical protein
MMKRTGLALSAAILGGLLVMIAGEGMARQNGRRSPDRARPSVKTPAEETAYSEYTQNEAIATFLSRLAAAAPDVLAVSVVGRSLPAESYGARDLFLVTLALREGDAAGGPVVPDPAKPTVLFTAAQHGNEQSAKEAVLRLVRDLAVGDLRPLLAKVNVLAMPQTNPYGNFMNVRVNELGLDMNRDHIKLETAGVRAIHRVFRAWTPEVTIDVHEKGDDYYRVSIGCVSNANIGHNLQDYSRGVILAEVERALQSRRTTFHEYLVTEALGVDTSSGAAPREARPAGRGEEMKRFSTSDLNDGRNSLGIFETLSFIQEGASRHDLETLAARTAWQYEGLRAFLGSIAGHAPEILEMVRGDRARLIQRAAARAAGDPVHLRMRYARDPGQPRLLLKRYATSASPIRGTLRVDKKAGETLTAADIVPAPGPRNLRVVDDVVENWFPNVEPTLSVPRPRGYIIRGARLDIVETLVNLGVEVGQFDRGGVLDAEVFEVDEIVLSAADYEAPERIEVSRKAARAQVTQGDFYVDGDQPAANLIPCLLEPQSQYGLIRYWKFKLTPEAGGVFEILRYAGAAQPPTVPYRPWGSS